MRLDLALLVALLLLLGCISFTSPQQQNSNQTVTPPPHQKLQCSQLANRSDADLCYYNDAVERSNLTECSLVFSDSLRDSCNLKLAVNSTDPSICTRIIDADTRDGCYNALAPLVGIATCNKIENKGVRDECRIDLGDKTVLCENLTADYDYKLCIAEAEGNYSICGEIENQSLWNGCYFDFAKSAGNYSLCNMLTDSGAMDNCFLYFANLNLNASLCNHISLNYPRDLCIANLTSDYTLCNDLSDYLQRDSCLEIFAVQHAAVNVCINVSTHVYQDRCYTGVALGTKDASICSRMTCYECILDKNQCYYQVANATLNPSSCGYISDQLTEDLCYQDTAKSSDLPAYCEYINNSYRRNTCFSSIIYNQQYPSSVCEDITYLNWADECYQKVAINSKNSTLCQYIHDSLVKSNCMQGSS